MVKRDYDDDLEKWTGDKEGAEDFDDAAIAEAINKFGKLGEHHCGLPGLTCREHQQAAGALADFQASQGARICPLREGGRPRERGLASYGPWRCELPRSGV